MPQPSSFACSLARSLRVFFFWAIEKFETLKRVISSKNYLDGSYIGKLSRALGSQCSWGAVGGGLWCSKIYVCMCMGL